MIKTLIKDCTVTSFEGGININSFTCNALIEWEAAIITNPDHVTFEPFFCGAKIVLNIEYEGKKDSFLYSTDHKWKVNFKLDKGLKKIMPEFACVNFEKKTIEIF